MLIPKSYKKVKTPSMQQMEVVECGAVCLRIILGYYGKYVPIEKLRVDCGVSRNGSSAYNIIQAASSYDLTAKGYRMAAEGLKKVKYPAIAVWNYSHYIVLEGIENNKVYINDPAVGHRVISFEEFEKGYSDIFISFEREKYFKKGGKPVSFFKILLSRMKKEILAMLTIATLCLILLITFLSLPASLAFFTDTYFSKKIGNALPQFITFIFALSVFIGLGIVTLRYISVRLINKLSLLFSSEFIWRLLRLPLSFYNQRFTGEIAARTFFNSSVAKKMITLTSQTIITVGALLLYSTVLFFFDIYVASVTLGLTLINIFLTFYILSKKSNDYAGLKQGIFQEKCKAIGALQYIETIKAKGAESYFFSEWAGFFAGISNSVLKVGKKNVYLSTVPVLFQYLSVAFLLGYGSLQIIEGATSAPILLGFYLLLLLLIQPTNQIARYVELVYEVKMEMQFLNDTLDNPIDQIYVKRQKLAKKNNQQKLTGELEFKNVTFSYEPLSPPVLQNLSFTIKPGEKLALVGPTGCGKSTLAKLASGLLHPNSGEILYNGLSLYEITSEEFKSSVATVEQEFFIFTGTVRENLTLWNSEISEESIIWAAKDAQIHNEIMSLKKGYDSLLLEGGRNLSGGQCQRIEIARAFVCNPALVILDEATSALDSYLEKKFTNALTNRGCSALIIAHRLSTIQDCDQIIVLDKGRMVQQGTHNQLKKVKGIYQDLVSNEVQNENL